MSVGNQGGKGGVRRPFNSVTSPWHRQCVKITSSSLVCVGSARKQFKMAMECFMGIIFLIVIIGTTTMAKSYSDTDLTSDITSTGYDQYPWSVLPPHSGPTVQEKLEWKWKANDRSEKGPIDKFLQSPWKKSSLLPAKHNSRSMSSNKKIEDKGPGSMEIYRLANIDESELNLITEWNNSELRKKMKNKLPKKSHYIKNSHKIQSQKDDLPTNKRQMTNKIIEIDELNDSRGVPELQIGCEGLEAPIEPSNREQRSISMNNDTTKDDYTQVETLVPPVNPVTIDWHYDDSNNGNKNYEEMDELLKLKKLENKKKIKQRSDIPPDEDIIDYDYKKIPTRGDLVSRKVRSIFDEPEKTRGIRRNKQDPWGFGEDEGYISGNNDDDDDDSDNSAQRIEADRRRQNYDRMQREEMERRRTLMIERQRERQREEEMRRANDELSQIDRIRKEYESRQSAEQREQERKLKEYIERNRPIVVEDRDARNRRIQEEFRRRTEASPNNVPVRPDHSRGPAPPINPSVPYDELRRRYDAEILRRQEEEARRREEEKRVADARRIEERLRAGENRTRSYPERRLEDERRNEEEYLRRREEEAENRRREEEKRRAEEERLRERQNQNNSNRRFEEERRRDEEQQLRDRQNQNNSNRRLEEERRRGEEARRREEEARRIQAERYEEDRRNRLMEQKKKELGVISFDQAQRRAWEEKRLNSLPVSARILLIPNSLTPRATTIPPFFGSRGNFDNDVDLPAINPNRPGLSASRFPAAPTPKPPSNSPGSCVWAVVQCCPNSDQRRLSNCFEHMGCPGVNWDSSPCRDSISNAARAEVVRYYASNDEQ